MAQSANNAPSPAINPAAMMFCSFPSTRRIAVAGAAVEVSDVSTGAVPPTLGAEDVQAGDVAGDAVGEAGDVQKGMNFLVLVLGIVVLALLIGLSVWYSSRHQKASVNKPSFEVKRRR